MPMVHIELQHMKQHMITAFHTHIDEIKAEIDRQITALVSAEGFKQKISETIEKQLDHALSDYVNRLVREALRKHEEFLKAAVMEHVARLMTEDQVQRLMQE